MVVGYAKAESSIGLKPSVWRSHILKINENLQLKENLSMNKW